MSAAPPEQRSPHGRAAAAAAAKRSKPPSRNPRRHGDHAHDDPDDAASALDTWLSFDDLRRAGIVYSWKTLGEWQRDPRIRFPLGRLLAPNTRRWSKQREIDPWLASRPVERDAFEDAERAAAEAQP
jgi:hypothetical protein